MLPTIPEDRPGIVRQPKQCWYYRSFAAITLVAVIGLALFRIPLSVSTDSDHFHYFYGASPIYTFVQDPGGSNHHGGEIRYHELVNVWEDSWNVGDSGALWWTAPKSRSKSHVLTEEDAKQHPMYRTAASIIRHHRLSPEQNMTFLRALAMAQVGGGWLSDMDVLPLITTDPRNLELPNSGRITIHGFDSATQLPVLISGEADEWLQYAWEILDQATSLTHHDDTHYKESSATTSSSSAVVVEEPTHVMPVDKLINDAILELGQCDQLEGTYALHFSKKAVENTDDDNLLSSSITKTIDEDIKYRAEIARQVMNEVKRTCGGPSQWWQTKKSRKRGRSF